MAMGDAFVSGFSAMTDARERKKRRQQDAELAAAERELRVTQQAKEHENRRLLQEAENTFRGTQSAEERAARAIEAEKDRGWRTGEGEKDRGFRREERIDSQGFTASEAALDRAARVVAQDKELKDRVDARNIEVPLAGARLGLMARAQEWDQSPNNPLNQYRGAAPLGKLGEVDDFTINGGAPSPAQFGALRPPQQVTGARPQMAGGQPVMPPAAAIDMLRRKPELAAEFDRKYGAGAAAKYLQRQ